MRSSLLRAGRDAIDAPLRSLFKEQFCARRRRNLENFHSSASHLSQGKVETQLYGNTRPLVYVVSRGERLRKLSQLSHQPPNSFTTICRYFSQCPAFEFGLQFTFSPLAAFEKQHSTLLAVAGPGDSPAGRFIFCIARRCRRGPTKEGVLPARRRSPGRHPRRSPPGRGCCTTSPRPRRRRRRRPRPRPQNLKKRDCPTQHRNRFPHRHVCLRLASAGVNTTSRRHCSTPFGFCFRHLA